MWKIFVGLLCFGCASGKLNWVSLARVPGFSGYMSRVVQEMIYDMEKIEWCTLRITEYSQQLHETLYQWRIVGNVTYSNGFLVSIQELDLIEFTQSVWNVKENEKQTPYATVRARLNMWNARVGFDVTVHQDNPEPPFSAQEKFTGHFTHTHLQLQLDVTKNMITNEITSSPRWTIVSGDTGVRMVYMPATNLTEVLSRVYQPNLNTDSVNNWGRNIFGPKLVDIATNRIPFPELCFLNCPS